MGVPGDAAGPFIQVFACFRRRASSYCAHRPCHVPWGHCRDLFSASWRRGDPRVTPGLKTHQGREDSGKCSLWLPFAAAWSIPERTVPPNPSSVFSHGPSCARHPDSCSQHSTGRAYQNRTQSLQRKDQNGQSSSPGIQGPPAATSAYLSAFPHRPLKEAPAPTWMGHHSLQKTTFKPVFARALQPPARPVSPSPLERDVTTRTTLPLLFVPLPALPVFTTVHSRMPPTAPWGDAACSESNLLSMIITERQQGWALLMYQAFF